MRLLVSLLVVLAAGCRGNCTPSPLELERTRFAVVSLFADPPEQAVLAAAGGGLYGTPEPVVSDLGVDWSPASSWWDESRKSGKPTFLFLTDPVDCPPCAAVEKLFVKKDVQTVMSRFVCVKVDTREYRTKLRRAAGLPAEDRKPLSVFVGLDKKILTEATQTTPQGRDSFKAHLLKAWHLSQPPEKEPNENAYRTVGIDR